MVTKLNRYGKLALAFATLALGTILVGGPEVLVLAFLGLAALVVARALDGADGTEPEGYPQDREVQRCREENRPGGGRIVVMGERVL